VDACLGRGSSNLHKRQTGSAAISQSKTGKSRPFHNAAIETTPLALLVSTIHLLYSSLYLAPLSSSNSYTDWVTSHLQISQSISAGKQSSSGAWQPFLWSVCSFCSSRYATPLRAKRVLRRLILRRSGSRETRRISAHPNQPKVSLGDHPFVDDLPHFELCNKLESIDAKPTSLTEAYHQATWNSILTPLPHVCMF
jgi:hypothetical protein